MLLVAVAQRDRLWLGGSSVQPNCENQARDQVDADLLVLRGSSEPTEINTIPKEALDAPITYHLL